MIQGLKPCPTCQMEISKQQLEALQQALQVVFNQESTPPAPIGMVLPTPPALPADPEQKEQLENVLQKFLQAESSPITPEEVIKAMGPERPPQKPWFTGHKAFPQKPF